MSGKYNKSDMLAAINLHCKKNGFYISYINKLTKLQLEAIIIKYDMNIEELMFELAELRDAEMIAREESKAKINVGIENIIGRIQMLLSFLNEEQKEKFYEYCDSQESNL